MLLVLLLLLLSLLLLSLLLLSLLLLLLPTTTTTTATITTITSSTMTTTGELHADYYESARFVYSAVLFLGEEAADRTALRGGELGLVDALEAAAEAGCGGDGHVRGHGLGRD